MGCNEKAAENHLCDDEASIERGPAVARSRKSPAEYRSENQKCLEKSLIDGLNIA
jgi:hypothetical protein